MLIRQLDQLDQVAGGAVTIGNFDGVHRGHARIIKRLREQARRCGGPACVLSFDPHPVRLLRPEQAPPPLTWAKRKAELLQQQGADALIAYPTDESLLQLPPAGFFGEIVQNRLQARAIVEGPNFYFGRNRAGTIDVLKRLCAQHSVALDIVAPVRQGDQLISSSRVRAAVAAGQVEQARHMLTQPYRLRGMVIHGRARGTKMGFPTANLDAIDTLIPALGVYAGRAYVQGVSYAAAIHIGPLPTFGENVGRVEVHILDFDQNIYGEPLEVDFLTRLRDIHAFPDVAALQQQLRQDAAAARAALAASQ
jgi:riboflavin kinase/FMN adenylyltransferase